MQIFAISDLHYSGLPPVKPMEIFHPMWEHHRDKIRASWLKEVQPEDVVLIGVSNRIEVWSKAEWLKYSDDINPSVSEIAETLADLGI